ncbi:Ubiquitin carboxyl-terminal hydrolase family protein [Acanthocheilonema viteae]
MDDHYDRQIHEDDSVELKWDSDSSKKRRCAAKRAFLVNDSHCSAPSSSPHSSPVDASMLTDFNSGELNDAIRTYSRCKNDTRPTKSEDENGDWWIQLDELPTRDDENDSPLLIRTSVSPVFAESMSSKSELEDVVESVESPQSKFELDEDDEQIRYPSTLSKRQIAAYFQKFCNVPEVPLPSVFHNSPTGRAMSSSAPASTVGSSSSNIGDPLQRPNTFDVKTSPSAHAELNAIASERPKEWEDFTELPSGMLTRLFDQLHRTRWIVPVLPNQELEGLMEVAIVLIKRGTDRTSKYFEGFLEKGLQVAFDKLMNDEALKDWKIEIHRFIWLSVARFLVMFTEKMRQTLAAEDFHHAYWKILQYALSSNSRYALKLPSFLFSSVNFHMQNFGRKADFLQMEFDPNELIRYTSINTVDEVYQRVLQLWLLLLLSYFGKIGGFTLMKNFLERNVNETTKITDFIDWLRPFASCSLLLKPALITETFGPTIQVAVARLEHMDDKELKCETVKGDLNESPYIELAKVLQSLLLINPEMTHLGRQMQFFSLRYILRVLQVAPFAGRIAALEELHMVLHNAASEFRQDVFLPFFQQEIVISMNDLTEWLRKQHLIEILVRDNLHHPSYCERLERVFRVLLERNAITVDDLDILWNVQREKHDVIQRNVHDLIAKLVNGLNNVLQKHLFERMKESWTKSSSRQRTLLLDLIRRIGVDFSSLTEKELTIKSLSLLWDLFHDERLPVEMIDAALEAHFNVLESAVPAEELRRHYIERCIDELLLDSVFVLPALKHMQRLMTLMPECDYSTGRKVTRAEYIATVQQDTELCSRLSKNVALYMEKVRNAVNDRPHIYAAVEDAGSLVFVGRYTHSDNLRIRLSFLHFLLSDGQLWLMAPQANELWDALIVRSVFDYERTYGFQLFGTMQDQEDIDPKALDQLFTSRILKLPVELLNEEGFSCFKTFWTSVNKKHSKLFQPTEGILHYLMCDFDLEGMDYLWEIMLQARTEVSHLAVSLWVEILANPHTTLISDFAHLIQTVVNKCFVMLKTKHDDLIKRVDSDDKKMKMLDRMGRILTALNSYICVFDDDYYTPERSQQPLRKAGLGRCFVLPLVFPDEKLPSGADTNSSLLEDEDHAIPVHSTMPLSALKLKIDDKLRHIDGCTIAGLLVPVQLTVQSLNPPETRTLHPSDRRKTLDELGIDSSAHIIIRLQNRPIRWNNRLSTDSSPDQTLSSWNEETTSGNEENERILPGSVIAVNPDHVRFLYTLADIGYAYGNNYLRKSATDVLNQIPPDTMSVTLLRELVESGRFFDLLPSESSNHALHLLRVLHSLLLPYNGHFMTEATEFQILFLTSPSCLAVFSFLGDPQILCRWDEYACTAIVWWLANIAKFVLFVAARLKYLRTANEKGNEFFETGRVIDREQAIFKELCCVVAHDLNDRIEKNAETIATICQLFTADSNRIECFLRLAWAVGSRNIPLRPISGGLAKNSSIETIRQSQPAAFTLEEPTECLLDAFAIEVVSGDATSEVLKIIHLWNLLVSDLLFCKSLVIRRYFSALIRRMVCRMGSAERQLSSALLQLLFNKLEESDEKLMKNAEFFGLLCNLLDHCRNNQIYVDDVMQQTEKILDWLDRAKQHTIANQESYPNDKLLIGRLDVCRSLLGFLTNEEKVMIGSEPNGTQLVKQLLDEFILPSSRTYVNLMRQRDNDSDVHIQRSVTHSAISRDIDESDKITPRSETMEPLLSSRSIPVCGTSESAKAAYSLIIALCDTTPLNYRCIVENLLELFYSESVPTMNIEWEYIPGYSIRSPNSYVGLKNGGATCYMNSVFQQIFMIEPLRNVIINANFTDDMSIEEMVANEYTVAEEHYHATILKAVQSIFAHLLGSEMQFYSPKFFWKHFRFYGQAVNVREQQDALEFYNALFDSIDEGLKKLGEPPICENLFGGTFADQKICKDCPHRYQREEPFTSISVDVRSHNNLLDSLKEYVKGDLLNNDNAYLCEECNKKVTAIKRLCVARLPPYLTIQLKRFDFDWERDSSQKYNDYFEFPIDLDMMPFTVHGLAQTDGEISKEELTHSSVTDSGRGTSERASPETNDVYGTAGTSTSEVKLDDNNTKYSLRGVIVHSGQANGGHYYSFIRSEEDGGRWFKFDDVDVTEWHLSKEEMQNMWFGGEYIAEGFENSSHYQKKRQKRWWNAYLLIYEKTSTTVPSVTSSSAELTTSSSTQPSHSSSNSPFSLDKKISAMSISSRIRHMPPKLEALVRGKNTYAMHERSQYTTNYFQFIRDICSRAVQMISQINVELQDDYYLLTTKLLSKFLFSTGLRAKKTLRIGNVTEWQKTYEILFASSKSSRGWFICNIMFQPKMVVLYLLTAPSTDVRYFFTNVFVTLLNAAAHDYFDVIRPYMRDCPDFKIEAVYKAGDTISDMFITLLLIIPRNYFTEFSTHPTQYIALFNLYALSGLEQKRQLVRKGALHALLVLISRDDYHIKVIYQDSSKLYEVISLLLRTCKFEWQGENANLNPYAITTGGLIQAPEEVAQWMDEPLFVNRLLKQLIELPTDRAVALNTILYLCWENLNFTKILLYHFSFECLFTPNEVKNATIIIENILEINDSVKRDRQRLVLLGFENGPQNYKGFIAIMFVQKDIYSWKAYHLLRTLIDIASDNEDIVKILVEDEQARNNLYRMKDWFKLQLAANSAKSDIYDYDNRRDDLDKSSEAEGMESFIEIYEKFQDFLSKLNIPSSVTSNGGSSSSDGDSFARDAFFGDMSMDVPGVSSERRLPYASAEHSRSAEKSSADYSRAETSSNVDPSKNIVSPIESKLSLKTGCSDEALTLGTSMSFSERLLANVGLPPPPPYSEHDSANTASQQYSRVRQPMAPVGAPHSWQISLSTGMNRPEDDSSVESTSTGVEMEDIPPPYE